MLVSSDADARYTPSVDHAISERPLVWPLKFLINSPVNGDHIFTKLSAAIQRKAISNTPSPGKLHTNRKMQAAFHQD